MSNCIILSGGTWSPTLQAKIKRPLGPYRLCSALEDQGYTTFVLDYINEFTVQEIIQVLSNHIGEDTLWFGFSSTFYWPEKINNGNTSRTEKDDLVEMYYTSDYSQIKKVIDFVRQNSNAKILYGGAKSPYYSESGTDKNIDYYVTGNADNSIIDITNFLAGKVTKLHSINGNVIDSFEYTEPDIKNISTHWWKKHYNILPNEGLPIELARGCIFKCKFCDFPLTGKKKGTYLRDPLQIKDELIKMWEVNGTDSYLFTDDTFNDDNDKLESLHKIFTDLPFKPKFSTYLRIDLINKYPHQADILTEMGMVGTFFGLETLQPESARVIGKGLHPSKVKDRLYWLAEKWKNKANIESGFIIGLPYDNFSYFNELLMWSLEEDNPIQAIHDYPLMLFYYEKNNKLKKYSSEFSLNPEIYGYEFNEGVVMWNLPSQKLNYNVCSNVASKFADLRSPMNKIAGFQMITSLNTGVELQDLYDHTQQEIERKYDIPKMNADKINKYKRLVGLYK